MGLREVTLTGGLLAERQSVVSRASIPAGWQKLRESHTLSNFEIAAGIGAGPTEPPVFRDSDAYKWLEAASWDLARGSRRDTEACIEAAIDLIRAAQQPDGYLDTQYSGNRYALRFQNLRNDHELYCAGHLFQAAVAHHRVTGSRRLLDVACRLADCLFVRFGPHGAWGACGHPEAEMGLIELYRTTRNEQYLVLAERMLQARGRRPSVLSGEPGWFPASYFLDHLPVQDQRHAVGHAVRATYLYAAIADLVAETGAAEYRAAAEALWLDAFTRKAYVTGGLGARHEGESFGAAYELPNERAYSETCAAIGGYMFSWRMLLLEPDARYADAMETALYNTILAGVSLDGTRFFYQNPLASRGGVERQPWFDTACCPPNLERTVASIGGTLFSLDDLGLWVHLYAACELRTALPDGRRLAVTVETDYPWQGRITLRLSAGRYRVALRIPGWARGAKLAHNDELLAIRLDPGSYAHITRPWSEGDTLVLELPLPVELLVCDPRVDNNRGAAAIRRGPVVYCLEGIDCPAADFGLDVLQLRAPPAGLVHGADWLPEAVLLTGELAFAKASGPLYVPRRERPSRSWQTSPAQWIPYFAWANRGPSPMHVWLPLA